VRVKGPVAAPASSLVMVTVGPPAAATEGRVNPTSAPIASTEAVAPAMNFLRRDLNETLRPELLSDILVPPTEIVNGGQVRPFVLVFSQGLLAIGQRLMVRQV
jgi:hypothetical protein